MALSASTVWEVRLTNGLDTNGGGFVAGASGTDRSQQNGAFASLTTLSVVNATTTKVTVSATDYTVSATDVGNILQITGGTATAGFYQITAATTGAGQTWTLDRSCGTAAQTVVGYMGGALLTVAKCMTAFVASNKAFVKAESGGTVTATTTLSVLVSPGNSSPPSRLIGYTTTRTDGGQATLTLSTNTGLFGLKITGYGWQVYNMAVDCGSLGTSTGISVQPSAGTHCHLHNCLVKNFTLRGVDASVNSGSNLVVHRCEVTGGTSAATAAIDLSGIGSAFAIENNVHDNACTGILASDNQYHAIEDNLITNNTGASSDGIRCSYGCLIRRNTIHGNGRHGINNSNAYGIAQCWKANSLSGNGGYGFVGASGAGLAAEPWMDGNAFGYPANTSGTFSNYNDTSTNPVNGVSPYANSLDQTVTAGTQYVSATTGDAANWALNATASQGALVDYAGQPATWPGESGTTGYPSIGAAQYKNSGGGGGPVGNNFRGGFCNG